MCRLWPVLLSLPLDADIHPHRSLGLKPSLDPRLPTNTAARCGVVGEQLGRVWEGCV